MFFFFLVGGCGFSLLVLGGGRGVGAFFFFWGGSFSGTGNRVSGIKVAYVLNRDPGISNSLAHGIKLIMLGSVSHNSTIHRRPNRRRPPPAQSPAVVPFQPQLEERYFHFF